MITFWSSDEIVWYQVDKVSRNRCTYCRWQKCLNSGMNQASVQAIITILPSYHQLIMSTSHHIIVISAWSHHTHLIIICRRGKRGNSKPVMALHNLTPPYQAQMRRILSRSLSANLIIICLKISTFLIPISISKSSPTWYQPHSLRQVGILDMQNPYQYQNLVDILETVHIDINIFENYFNEYWYFSNIDNVKLMRTMLFRTTWTPSPGRCLRLRSTPPRWPNKNKWPIKNWSIKTSDQ